MKLVWSQIARRELTDLRRSSIERWGLATATSYMDGIRRAAKRLANDYRIARVLNERFRIHRIKSHYLIVRVDEPTATMIVARVLHTAMDIERHLPRVE